MAWLAGKVTGKARATVLAQLASGEAQVVVGTHALMQEAVVFHDLELAEKTQRIIRISDRNELRLQSVSDELEREKKKLEGVAGQLAKYLPRQIYDSIFKGDQSIEIKTQRKLLTVFFSDIQGFTHISSVIQPEVLTHYMNAYFTEMSDIAAKHGGTIDKYIGDSIMAFWNAPEPTADHALRACRAALDSQTQTAGLNRKWAAEGRNVVFRTRIGINTGEAIVGNIGSVDRMSYTIIGDQVNLVSRLEAANKFYGTSILLSENTFQQVHTVFATRLVDQVIAYGKTVPIRVYELLGEHGQLPAGLEAIARRYEAAFGHYGRREFAQAAGLLETNLSGDLADPPSRVLLDRCRRFMIQPPAADWDGSFVLTSK